MAAVQDRLLDRVLGPQPSSGDAPTVKSLGVSDKGASGENSLEKE